MTANDVSQPTTTSLAARLQAALGEAYTVERELGAGGFAVVFLVHDLALKRKLAIKVVSPELIASPSVIARFRREAETVAQLSHANIVPLHFIGQQDDLLYIAMSFVDGGSLDTRISNVPGKQMPIDDIRRAMCEVASALAHAHKRGVTHRDIKPQNVLIDADSGRCLVTDFGIAKTVDTAALTISGMVIGTPAYLAPEQLIGEASDHRADIYALGVMAYEMVSGTLPFEAPTPSAMMLKRLGAPPKSVGRVRTGVPRDLQDVISGCLASNPAERFQTAEDVVRALGGSDGTGVHARVVARARRRLATKWAAGLLVVAAAVTVGVMLDGNQAPRTDPVPVAAGNSAPVTDSSVVLIPAGAYLVGDDSGSAASRPAHRVELPAFSLGRYEVTVGEYREYVDSTGAPPPWSGADPAHALPVSGVQWAEASGYCRWRHPRGGNLPTEEQWEAAARRFTQEGGAGAAGANVAGTGSGRLEVVGSRRGSSREGIHDLIGNVWEWTSSPMRAYPGGTPMPESLQGYRVIRGGGFNTPARLATVSQRGYSKPDAARADLVMTGFRCAVAAP